jgi:hypothetical protein
VVALPAGGARGRAGPLEAQDEGADEGVIKAGADDEVLGAVGGAEPRVVHVLGLGEVAAGEEADGDEVDGDDAAGEDDGGTEVPMGTVGEAVGGGEAGDETGEAQRMGDEGAGGLLAHLGDRVGDEVQAGDLVVVALEGLEIQRWNVVHGDERLLGEGRGGVVVGVHGGPRVELRRAGVRGQSRGVEDQVGPEKGEEGYSRGLSADAAVTMAELWRRGRFPALERASRRSGGFRDDVKIKLGEEYNTRRSRLGRGWHVGNVTLSIGAHGKMYKWVGR